MTHRIGLIADVQYADIDDVWNFMKTHKRKYRATLGALKNAVNWWSSVDSLSLIVDLGDAIDGFRNDTPEMGISAIRTVMREWYRVSTLLPSVPSLHLLGNHELYKFTRDELTMGVRDTGFCCSAPPQLPECDKRDSIHYSFKLPGSSRWRVVVLDPYVESVMTGGGGRVGHELTLENGGLSKEYTALCQRNNPNDIIHGANYFAGLEGVASRWCPFNGGLGSAQLKWFESVLASALAAGEYVLVFSHVIIHPSATPSGNCHTILWDYDKVLATIARFPCVKLVVCGHAHHSGYFECPETSVHHITLASPLEAPEDLIDQTFGILEVSDNSHTVKLSGRGWVDSMDLRIRGNGLHRS